MVEFEIFGPFDTGFEVSGRGRGGPKRKTITKAVGKTFWESVAYPENGAHVAAKKGCYVFVLSAGRGSMPWYVGKTEKSARTLKREVFDEEKLRKYRAILSRSKRRTAKLFLLVRSAQRGRLGRAIDDLETFLIWAASHRNKDILNRRKRDTQPARLVRIANSLSIKGFLNARRGAPSSSVRSFEQAMRLRERL
jgi:hypothetical protein